MSEIFHYLAILSLLWCINFVPPLLAFFLGDRWNQPLDFGSSFVDGKPLLGPHKTLRGTTGAIAVGAILGMMMGMPWWVGLAAGTLSMAGDITSSFVKRRLSLPSGSGVAGFDQVVEGFLPFLVLQPHFSLSAGQVYCLVIFFCTGAFAGSWFLRHVLLKEPFADYPRPIKPRVRLRELRRCQLLDSPLRYLLNFEDAFYYHFLMKTTFKAMGIYEQGRENALELATRQVTFRFPDLPASFEGYSILYMSDLHLDGLPGLTDRIRSLVDRVYVDLCILGGDFRMETYGPYDSVLSQIRDLVPHLHSEDGILSVLGNHDCLEMVRPMERLGIRFLINDARAIERNGEKIWFVGIDDPHHFRCHNLGVAFQDVPQGAFSVFLSHSNEVYREAARYNPRLYLCGHTHGGQICVPSIGPVFTHSRAPRRLCHGQWHHDGMLGFTSCGVGVSGVPVRFRTKGEILLITLRRLGGNAERGQSQDV